MAKKNESKADIERRARAAERAKILREKSSNTIVGRQVSGFMSFIREQGVVGLAVGLAIGTAATVLVKSAVDNIVTPLIGWLLPGSGSLADKTTCLNSVDGQCVNQMAWGIVVANFISFMAVAALIYFVVMGLKLDKIDKKKD